MADDKCISCGEKGHFIRNCPNKNLLCERCGRKSHSATNCYATVHIDGQSLTPALHNNPIPEDSRYPCEHCGARFISKQNLYTHRKRAKYCLEKRGVTAENFECECGKKYSVRKSLRRHQETCALHKPRETTQLENMMQRVISQYDELRTIIINNHTKV